MPSKTTLSRAFALLAGAAAFSIAGCGGGGGDAPASAPSAAGGAPGAGAAAVVRTLADAYQLATVPMPDLPVTSGPFVVGVALAKWRIDGQRIGRTAFAFDGAAWRSAPPEPVLLLGANGWRASTTFPTDGQWTALPEGAVEITHPDWDGLAARIERIDSFFFTGIGHFPPDWTPAQPGARPSQVLVTMPERVATQVLRWRFPTDVHSVDPDHALQGTTAASLDALAAEFRDVRACQVRIQGDVGAFSAWLHVDAAGNVRVGEGEPPLIWRSGRDLAVAPMPGTLANWQPTPTCEPGAAFPPPVAASRRRVAGQEVVVLDGVPPNVLKALGCYEVAPTNEFGNRGRPICKMILASVGGTLRPGLLRPRDTVFVEAVEHSYALGQDLARGLYAHDRAGIDAQLRQLSLPAAP